MEMHHDLWKGHHDLWNPENPFLIRINLGLGLFLDFFFSFKNQEDFFKWNSHTFIDLFLDLFFVFFLDVFLDFFLDFFLIFS